jgi:glucokinase
MSSPASPQVLALDFGGSKLIAAVVAPAIGKILSLKRAPTPVERGADGSIELIAQLGNEAITALNPTSQEIEAIGISFGGPVSRDRRHVVHSMHVSGWDSVDLPDRIGRIFAKPAYMDNDANAAALGEWRLGAGHGVQNMLYVQVSTGIGAGLILNGNLYRGSGLAGELGHIIVCEDGPLCTCGKKGCVESLASGWAIARDGKALMEKDASTLLSTLAHNDPTAITAELVLLASKSGDPGSQSIFRHAFRSLAAGIAILIRILDPEVIVIGGGVAQARESLLEVLNPALKEFLSPVFRDRVELRFSTLAGYETLFGAALLTRGFG